MATLNEIAYSLLNTLRHGRATSTERISLDQIKYFIINKRSQYIRNELNKNRTIDPRIVQDLGCVEVEQTDSSECCDIPSGCVVIRTKKKIPSTVELHNEYLITRVGPINKLSTNFDLVEYERVPFLFRSKFSKKRIRSFMIHDGGYIYIVMDKDNPYAKMIKNINIQGVFEDPREARNFQTEDCKPCYTDDSEFPIKTWMISSLEKDILESSLFISGQAPYDNTSGKQELTVDQKGQ